MSHLFSRLSFFIRQHDALIYEFVRLLVSFMCQETFYDTSKQVRRLSFGVLTVLTNIISTKVLWLMEEDLQWKTTLGERQPSVEGDLWWKTTFGGLCMLPTPI